MRRVIASLVLLPWILGVGLAGVSMVSNPQPNSGGPGFFPLTLFFAFYTYIYIAVPVFPLLALCLWRKWTRLMHAVLVGAFTGLTVFVSSGSSLFFNSHIDLGHRLSQLPSGYRLILLGAFTGALFWFMAFWRMKSQPQSEAAGAA